MVMGMVVDVGVVKNHIKPKADSTLCNMRKVDLIEYIRTLEHNYNVAVSFNENQAKYIESLDIPKWIPVTERLPTKDGYRVLCNIKSSAFPGCFYQSILRYDKYGFRGSDVYTEDVTHWMPLPEPPK